MRQIPHKCPVCNGTGKIYQTFGDTSTTSGNTSHTECHACNGTGIVWGWDYTPVPYCPQAPSPPWEITWESDTSQGMSTGQLFLQAQ